MDEEVFLYHTPGEGEARRRRRSTQAKASCACRATPAERARPVCFDAGTSLGGSGEGLGLVVDRPEVWAANTDVDDREAPGGLDDWLAGSVPGWTTLARQDAPYQSRYLSNSGRLFFNSADALVPG